MKDDKSILLDQLFNGLETAYKTIKKGQNAFLVFASMKELNSIKEMILSFFTSLPVRICVYEHVGFWGMDRYVPVTSSLQTRSQILGFIAEGVLPCLVLMPFAALGQKVPLQADLKNHSLFLECGMIIDPKELCERLGLLGYKNSSALNEKGTFSLFGGIVSIFPNYLDKIVRIEFLADSILSIQMHDQNLHSLEKIFLGPIWEAFFDPKDKSIVGQKIYEDLLSLKVSSEQRDAIMASFYNHYSFTGFQQFFPYFRKNTVFFNYLKEDDLVFCFGSKDFFLKKYMQFFEKKSFEHSADSKDKKPCIPITEQFLFPKDFELAINDSNLSFYQKNLLSEDLSFEKIKNQTSEQKKDRSYFENNQHHLKNLYYENKNFVLSYEHDEDKKLLTDFLTKENIAFENTSEILLKNNFEDRALLIKAQIISSFFNQTLQRYFIPSKDLIPFSLELTSPEEENYFHQILSSFFSLNTGDYVIHKQYGMGRYQGLKTLTIDQITGDYIEIAYANNDKIFLPAINIDHIQKHQSAAGATLALDSLTSKSFALKKEKALKEIEKTAFAIMQAEAKRALLKGLSFGSQTEDYLEFTKDFPYEETEDQLKVLFDIEKDFAAGKPMDRIIVGDVGFGKTEIAMRASMRAVLAGYQVILLVPTTILAYQHTTSFQMRMEKYGVRICQLTRGSTLKEQKQIKEDFAKAQIDILIGTHRLLSDDIKAKNLGLLIVDEEQKFGVLHKEKIKAAALFCHILTMTATPIPRTLHMALTGIKAISLLASPPKNRRPIITHLYAYDQTVVKEAIDFELARGGQIFYVHNKVQDIHATKNRLQAINPSWTIQLAHGQMKEAELEKIIFDFISGQFQILICTTIIESGVDMPHVNTLIVEDADHFGLAQLYQLKGRIGRSSSQGYAFFFVPSVTSLSKDAFRRLHAICQHQSLGSGFNIASIDLEIRGAGSIAGDDQSGHMQTIGTELYLDMLKNHIHLLKDQPDQLSFEVEIKLNLPAYIDSFLIKDEAVRIELYKKIFTSHEPKKLYEMKDQLSFQFGLLPKAFENLFIIAHIRLLAQKLRAVKLQLKDKKFVEVSFASLSEKQIFELKQNYLQKIAKGSKHYELTSDYRLILKPASMVTYDKEPTDWLSSIKTLLHQWIYHV